MVMVYSYFCTRMILSFLFIILNAKEVTLFVSMKQHCGKKYSLWTIVHSICKKSGVWWSKIINCKPNWFSDFWISFEYISIIYLTYLTTFNKIDNCKPWKNVGVVVGNNEGFELNLDQPIPTTIYGQFIITFKSQTSS